MVPVIWFFSRAAIGIALISLAGAEHVSYALADDTGTISGTVRQYESNLPVSGVKVRISANSGPVQLSLVTDGNGRYNAIGLNSGHYKAVFAKDGMDTELSLFEICPGSSTVMDMFMIDSPRACGMCPFVRSQPKQRLFSTTSTIEVTDHWSGMLDQFCL
jgi:hypothetical protein